MKIGIFTAVEHEASSFLKENATKISDGDFSVYFLKLGSHDAVLCCPPSVGEIAAAASCQLLISKYKVDVIINFGAVGALTESVSVLSAVYVESVVHYDMDTTQIDKWATVGRYGCFDDAAVKCDGTLLDKAVKARNLPIVRCASADKFVDDSTQKSALHTRFSADICDMESAGVLFTCKFNNVPCLLVKCVSDSLIGGANEYEEKAAEAAKDFFRLATEIADCLE